MAGNCSCDERVYHGLIMPHDREQHGARACRNQSSYATYSIDQSEGRCGSLACYCRDTFVSRRQACKQLQSAGLRRTDKGSLEWHAACSPDCLVAGGCWLTYTAQSAHPLHTLGSEKGWQRTTCARSSLCSRTYEPTVVNRCSFSGHRSHRDT